ncbi:Exodeoxyribonuclease I [hydrothermal vent metagenome]|uniref:Exodeoxyribonuclease I n=1 Tax=hydrothermal vent metagenome TaxID=652676 RepID=A0A3B0X8Z5_9ZZZZ
MTNSIYWYDYETFGIDPKYDRLSQFAGIRTDENLNIISDPLTLYCKPADDCLPDPYACLITGITPQKALADGINEVEFISTIHREFSTPNTCVAGFNNIRFDDEFTRNTLYRNFFNAYAHEWQQGNSRWDIIDTVRLTRALRPEGINWPEQDGRPSIRLELLTAENNIKHETAHDAMSDVYATIAVAKLIKQKQPRLYQYIYNIRKKNDVSKQINLQTHEAILHVSSRYSAERGAIAMVMPICQHPVNKNGFIVYDLDVHPEQFFNADSEEMAARLYTPAKELPEGIKRIPLKQIHINKCPVIVPLKTMDNAAAQRLNIDVERCQQHRELIMQNIDAFVAKTTAIFQHSKFPEVSDPDGQLYSGGFFSRDDAQRIDSIRNSHVDKLASLQFNFDDARLEEMLFRFRARNYSETLNEKEREQWDNYRHDKFTNPENSHRTKNQFLAMIESIQQSPNTVGSQLVLLEDLLEYAKSINV